MPFKSEKQRRWMYANEPALARKWSKNYADGGLVEGPLHMADGGVVGEPALFMADGGLIERASDWITDKTGIETPGLDRQIQTPGLDKLKDAGWAALDFVPIVGDIKGAWELTQELRKEPINWVVVSALTAALVIGLVPGIGDAAAAGIKGAVRSAAKAGRLVPADLIGIIRAAKDGDVDFLRGWGAVEDTASVGAKVAKPKKYYIQEADGTVSELEMTSEEFREAFGIGVSGEKKPRGRTNDDRQWAKSPDGFGDKRTTSGNPLIAEKRLDDVSYDTAKGQRRHFPRNLSKVEKFDAELILNEELTKGISDYKNTLPDDALGVDGSGFHDNAGFVNERGWVDYKKNSEVADKIREAAWPEIKDKLKTKFGNLSNEEFNKILTWARSKSGNVFDMESKKGFRTPGAAERFEELFKYGPDLGDDNIPIKQGNEIRWVTKKEFNKLGGNDLQQLGTPQNKNEGYKKSLIVSNQTQLENTRFTHQLEDKLRRNRRIEEWNKMKNQWFSDAKPTPTLYTPKF